MRFLADESCDFGVVRALRAAGYDVVAVSEVSPRAEDSEVIDLAVGEGKLLLTEDKDFGQLFYAHGQRTMGVIFLRYPVTPSRTSFRSGAILYQGSIGLTSWCSTNSDATWLNYNKASDQTLPVLLH